MKSKIFVLSILLFTTQSYGQVDCNTIRTQLAQAGDLDREAFNQLVQQFRNCGDSGNVIRTTLDGQTSVLIRDDHAITVNGQEATAEEFAAAEEAIRQRLFVGQDEGHEQIRGAKQAGEGQPLVPVITAEVLAKRAAIEQAAQQPVEPIAGSGIQVTIDDPNADCTNIVRINDVEHRLCSGSYEFNDGGEIVTQSAN